MTPTLRLILLLAFCITSGAIGFIIGLDIDKKKLRKKVKKLKRKLEKKIRDE